MKNIVNTNTRFGIFVGPAACPDNCENYRNHHKFCITVCVQGCFCQKPYIYQKGESGPCVLPQQCSQVYTEYYK
ncbi:unnamed protein product [Staurois parvus]|uniref:TIL domain-containing protein n=1 Tax=Staurois parvus TaxID=386267 RepID=A0ABN9AQJ3_9NEOB|nr:unnamed protein product [Staurois parvus]